MNKGFAFLTFENEKATRKALNYDGHSFFKRKLRIEMAESKLESNRRQKSNSHSRSSSQIKEKKRYRSRSRSRSRYNDRRNRSNSRDRQNRRHYRRHSPPRISPSRRRD
jgi:RNA recognition motif-containing protein